MMVHDSSVSIVILRVAIHSGGAQSAQSRSQELATAKRPTTSRIHHRTKGVRTKALTPEWIVSEMNYIGAPLLKICSSKYATQKLTLKNWQPKSATSNLLRLGIVLCQRQNLSVLLLEWCSKFLSSNGFRIGVQLVSAEEQHWHEEGHRDHRDNQVDVALVVRQTLILEVSALHE